MDSSRPNILLIHGHDLGQYLGCYGVDIETPNIDSLAADGALFERHFATAPQCSPSRGSLMTGRHPHVNGLMGLAHGDWELHDDERILPQYVSDAGYETHLFGLQHISQDTDRLEYDRVHSEGNLYPGVSPAVHQANRARNVASVVSSFLDASAYEEPLFASIGFFECHRAEEEDGRFGFDANYYGADDPDTVRPLPYLPDRRGHRHDLAEMRGMMYAVDEGIGTILDALDENGLTEDTLVIFTTEHGIAFPRAKGTCYDAGIEAALVMRYPGVITADERYDELISNVDVLPTVLDLIDVDVPEAIDGRSFVNLITDDGDSYAERERIFAEMTWHDMYNPVRAIRTDRYKYVRSFWHLPTVYLPTDVFVSESGREVRETDGVPPRQYEELYDLRDAPQEDDNVVYEPRYQDVRQDLSRELYEWMDETDDPLLDGPVLPGDYDEIQSWPHEST
ncbi:sulfatase (plasmid) [Natrialba magadii ATCC 43099]|uniref:Sulfatase n=1 Tax=Natrialba magadii (strain ATCC 43099 / DSM 3394 / CCM 3739 / CIP 104546 / IAM 13178 / JCM 8861 / NBRC 102185 / NCIMB 2190 / MS3) TaxID=547559 RepID=D3T1A7_NATMM|nr:sulfatase [Natrialba magadii]ADD07366.1 sulfatase [Natrialba magadii ATCC 43099]ELY32436.1 sulfatase [Natrialba magadii ATCC 43099]